MARFEKLDASQAVTQLSGWTATRDGKAIGKNFVFADFARALGFMTCVGVQAEKLDHHPEWRNVYNRVEVELTTHDAGTVTTLDLSLARFMDEVS
ncbi:4a-hydroxytetrahydrobiopterin dehydratase [Sphingomonadales bacterium 56]|nr:4a-hydroxytetrahydrobiopterin dehydratase [Sphingobium sp. S8]MBY2929229.1 4a-hydroxytetrahydrobiopterin dehydratase [Sphingomonadales bacterium 56]MBY2958859.1 4a-hydroxytetrahydrobiopterin dehydratase [Sphingomonadales bacterium 58]CAD7337926.1 Putative pterin-4-alpha-carbinolamine dehydratase [Sphingobium sp. S8]CAD7339036.1 Putative pterin-4-alpha-carbinolamine dehydratase [Sphingobium sp. S6]